MRDIGRQLAANSGEDIGAAGNFIFLKSATGNIRINIQGRGDVIMQAGDNLKLGKRFEGFRLEDASGAQNNVVLAIGDGDQFARSIVQGAVSVSGHVETIENSITDNSYQTWIQIAATPGLQHEVLLRNPTGSGRRVIFTSLKIRTADANGLVWMFPSQLAAANLLGVLSPNVYKMSGGAESPVVYSAVFSQQGNVAFTPAGKEDVYVGVGNVVSQPVFDRPIELFEGWGMTVHGTAANQALEFIIEWTER